MKTTEDSTKHGKKILIIEDDELIADVYSRHFEAACFEVRVEKNGAEGYYQIFESRPDAVLLDLLLPGMDGPSIIRKFRAQKNFTGLPIIVFTNAYLSEIGRDAASAGATKVFDKARVTPQEIVAAVVDALSGKLQTPVAPDADPKDEGYSREESIFGIFQEAPFSSVTAAQPGKSSPRASVEQPLRPDASQPVEPGDELAFQAAARSGFLQKAAGYIDALREIVCLLKVEAGRTPKTEAFLEMSHIAHAISGHAGIVGLHHLAHLAAALEAFARELSNSPSRFDVPKRYLFAKAIDMIARLVACGSTCHLKEVGLYNVLVVDDDAAARTMITKTLERACIAHVATSRSEVALELLRENKFDLAILDVNMDGVSGFEICAALQKMDHQFHCPVIFVTVLSDFHSKMVSLKGGGKDFIIKPFAPTVVSLKVFLYMIGAQLGPDPTQ